ncbi:MAG: hypothetical protein J6T74_00450 [Clostridia bacterium]|nr:hypothetical protein [Clostridia bacterium]
MENIVKQRKNKYTATEVFTFLILLFFIVLIALNPAKYSMASFKGLEVWAKILVPSLLPFFILTKLFASSGIIYDISNLFAPATKKLFKCPPITAYIFFMSVITGYPVGSKLIADMYNNKNIDKYEAQRALAFCSNSGPMFILGSVAVGMFGNKKIGIIILISHIIGSILNGIIYRNTGKNHTKKQKNEEKMQKNTHLDFNFSKNVFDSVSSILLIGGVICFCFVIIEAITSNTFFINMFSRFGKNANIFSSLFCGLFEITKGCLMLSECSLPICTIVPLLTFIISFGGISTMLQAMAFTNKIITIKKFCLIKFTHAIFSLFFCLLILFVFKFCYSL